MGAAAGFWYASKGSFTELLQLSIWGHAALLAGRNIPIFAIVAAPPVAGAVGHWLGLLPGSNLPAWLKSAGGRISRLAAGMAEMDDIRRWHLVSAAGVLLVAALLFAPAPPRHFRAEYDPKSFPAAAVEVLRGDSSARIFTNDVWGGYLIYRLYPQTRVFVDGRSDFYGADFRRKVSRCPEREVRLGEDSRPLWRQHHSAAHFGVSGRSAQGIRPLARGLRRRRRGGLPALPEGRGHNYFRHRWWRRNRP